MKLLIMCIAAVLSLLLSPLHAQQYGWKIIARPTARDLFAVDFTDPLHGWCASSDSIYRTTDGGNTWYRGQVPTAIFSDISFFDNQVGWASGTFIGGGGVLKTTNGGASWRDQYMRMQRRIRSTFAQSLTHNTTTGTKYFAADTSITIQTINGGTTWTERTLADSIIFYTGAGKIDFVDPLHAWATAGLQSGQGAILRTDDGGKTWEITRTPYVAAISFIDTLQGWFVIANPPTHAYHTTDGGVTWKQGGRIYDPMWDDLHPRALCFVDSLNGWAFGNMFYRGFSAEVIYYTTDGGLSWIQESVGLTGDFGGVEDAKMLDRDHGWAVCGRGYVLGYQILTEVAEKLPQKPNAFSLHQNYPNPFNASTEIMYEVQNRMIVNITVYNALGRAVRQLVHSAHEPGVYRLRFEGSDLASGEYHYIMKAGAFTATQSMTLLK